MYNGAKVLDVHSHVHDTTMTDRTATPRFAESYWSDLISTTGLGRAQALPSPIDAGRSSDRPGLRDEDFKFVADHLTHYITERRIDAQILSPHPLSFHGWIEDKRDFRAWNKYQNDFSFKLTQGDPEHFLTSCWVPQRADEPDTSSCIEELDRCVELYAAVACYVSPDPTGRRDTPPMNTPYWFPLYKRCQDLGIPIIIHGTDIYDPRYRQMNVGRYFEFNFLPPQTMATVVLRENNVFKEFPNLKIIVCHCGGFIERLGHGSQFRAAERAHTGSLWYDTAAYDPDFLGLAIKQRGAEHFVFGTEAPGSGVERRPGTETTADDIVPLFENHPSLAFLTEEEKVDILSRNPAKLFPSLMDPKAHNAKARALATAQA